MSNTNSDKKQFVCNCLNLRMAALSITELYNKMLAPSGININQYSLLKHLKKLEPVSVSDLSKEMRLDRTTLVRNLKVLEEKEYIIDISAMGTRSRKLQLTNKGYMALEEAKKLWKDAQNYVEQYLGKEDLKTLNALLLKIENLSI